MSPSIRPSLLSVVLIAGAAVAAAPAQLCAQSLPRVAIVAAADSNSNSSYFTDPRDKLMSTGEFSEVAIINAYLTTPTLAQLEQYDAVLVWSVMDFANWTALGNVMANYVDGGGGVVVTIFANTLGNFYRLGGRWMNEGYDIIPGDGGTTSLTGTSQSIGTIHDPNHPILQGVNTFNGGTRSFRPTTTSLTSHGIKIAEWTDGKTLVAVSGLYPNRVDLGLYPPSEDTLAGTAGLWWDSSTDGARLMANALLYTFQGGTDPCYANCDGSTSEPILTVDDFTCFINEFAAAQSLPIEQQVAHYANCDGSTSAPVLTVDDFTCFINEFAQGCP